MERLLILNPGSTSTKLAVFEGENPLFTESITHSAEELAPFDCVADQYGFRRDLVLDCLKRYDISLDSLNAIVSRGGLLTPIEAGAYEVNEDMVWQLKNKPQNEHASNVGAMIANGERPADFANELKYVSHVHISEPGLAPIQPRALHKELALTLGAVGWKGWVSLEMKAGDPDALRRSLEYMAEVFP